MSQNCPKKIGKGGSKGGPKGQYGGGSVGGKGGPKGQYGGGAVGGSKGPSKDKKVADRKEVPPLEVEKARLGASREFATNATKSGIKRRNAR